MPAEFRMHSTIIDRMFKDRQVMAANSITKLMLGTIKRPRAYLIRGRAKTVGGLQQPSAAVIDTCFRRMVKFADRVRAVLAAEFPAFDVLASFRVFSCSASQRSDAGAGVAATVALDEDRIMCLRRLAQCLELDEDKLIAEYNTIAPFARSYFRHHDCSNHEAWATALKSRGSRLQQLDTMRAALCRYGAWVASSADTERCCSRTFSTPPGPT